LREKGILECVYDGLVSISSYALGRANT
jgi:hypothetical protein